MAPALALLIAAVMRYSEDSTYTFASAFHLPTYIFLSLVVAMFLGLTNSADEIIRDRATLQRERNHNVRKAYYILSKLVTLGIFAAAQCGIYLWVGNSILEITDMFLLHLAWMFLTCMTGVAMGLLVSSMVPDFKTALNVIPLLLVPQIILGGALIKYEEMNRNLDFVYSIKRWMADDQNKAGVTPPSRLKVPLICETMPLRWSYEGMILAQDKLNPYNRLQDDLGARIRQLALEYPPGTDMPPEVETEFRGVKSALAVVSGLSGDNEEEVRETLKSIAEMVASGKFDASKIELPEKTGDNPITADELYENRKVHDLVTKAEIEFEHHKGELEKAAEDGGGFPDSPPNVFFNETKVYAGVTVPTMWVNAFVLLFIVSSSSSSSATSSNANSPRCSWRSIQDSVFNLSDSSAPISVPKRFHSPLEN